MKGFIYVIRSHQTEDIYYGSTKQRLSQRIGEHRRNYYRYIEGQYGYTSSYDIVQFDDAYIELVEEVEYENRDVLLAREGFHIRNNKCVNKLITGRTRKEYQEEHKKHIQVIRKKYHEEHKEERNERSKTWRKENKIDVSDYNKQYHEEHKEEINKRRREKRKELKSTI